MTRKWKILSGRWKYMHIKGSISCWEDRGQGGMGMKKKKKKNEKKGRKEDKVKHSKHRSPGWVEGGWGWGVVRDML